MKVYGEKMKKCPKCGAMFACQGEDDCWCESYRIHKKGMVRLMNEFTDCICPRCLKEYEGE